MVVLLRADRFIDGSTQTEAEKAAIRTQAIEASKGGGAVAGDRPALKVKGNKQEKEDKNRPKKPHRLSRIKRRRMEAMKADEDDRQAAYDDDDDSDGGGGGGGGKPAKKKAKAMPVSQKALAREVSSACPSY